MCTTCGCGHGETRIDGHAHDHGQQPDDKHSHQPHGHDHSHGHHHHYGQGAAGTHAPGLSQSRMVQIEQDILGKNNEYARANRAVFDQHRITALNLVSSPGSGKTTLLTRTLKQIAELPDEWQQAVIEGDQETSQDAERIRSTGVPACQVNTGKGCHLDAHMVGHALEQFDLDTLDLLFIENVGNLVCPSGFDLGEDAKVVILSVTEGEDKPLKYPNMFHAASLMLLNKVDLLPHLEFDVEQCLSYARQVNPNIEIIQISATTGEGLDQWLNWIDQRRRGRLEQEAHRLRQQLAQVEQSLTRALATSASTDPAGAS